MNTFINTFVIIISFQFSLKVFAKKDCIVRHVENADTVCVCNTTYCDDFPPLQRPKPGYVSVYESNKFGDRFKQTVVKFKPFYEYHKLSKKSMDSMITITVNKSIRHQAIYGFGGAFTDSTGFMLSSVDESLAAAVIDSYYSTHGIEYSFGRVPIGGTDFSLRPYTLDDYYNDVNLTHFALQREDYEWKIPYIRRAESVCPHQLKLIASNWCPPVWMKQTETFIAFSELKGRVGGQYYDILANYLVKFLNAYKAQGIDFWGLTSQNEPTNDFGLNTLKFTAESLKTFIEDNLGPTLEKSGYKGLKLMIIDSNIDLVANWTDIILRDSRVDRYVSGVGLHWYFNEFFGSAVEEILDSLHEKHRNYFVLNTEACILQGGNGRWDSAERYAYDIIKQLNHWSIGWIEWNMALDLTAGPNWFERTGCGGPVYIDPQKNEAYKQPTFYALGHFSKFLSPHSVRIEQQFVTNVDNVYVLAAKRPDNGLVVVVLNRNDIDIDVNLFMQNNWFTNKIPGHSIQTYLWW